MILNSGERLLHQYIPLEVVVRKYSHWFKRKVFENLQGYKREKPLPMLYLRLTIQPSNAFASMVANY